MIIEVDSAGGDRCSEQHGAKGEEELLEEVERLVAVREGRVGWARWGMVPKE